MKNANRFLIICFMAILLLPFALAACFPNAARATTENRTLADFPSVGETGLFGWTGAFDTWLNDHLPFKGMATKAYSNTLHNLLGESSSTHVIEGKEGWLFYRGYENDDPIADLTGVSTLSQEDMDNILGRLQCFEAAHTDVPFVQFMAPNKESVFRDLLPDTFQPYFASETRSELLRAFLADRTDFCFPEEELLALRESFPYPLYYKYDTHWNSLGAYFGLTQACDRLGVTLPRLEEVTIRPREDLTRYDLAALSNTQDRIGDDRDYDVVPYDDVVVTAGEKEKLYDQSFAYLQRFSSNAPNEQTLIMVGDSFSEVMMDVAPSCFQNVIYIRRDTAHKEEIHELTEELIEQNPGCIVIMEMVERGAWWLKTSEYVF